MVGAADQSGDGAQAALDQPEECLFLAVFPSVETVAVDAQFAVFAQGEQAFVGKTHLQAAAGAGAQQVFLLDDAVARQRHRLIAADGDGIPAGQQNAAGIGCQGGLAGCKKDQQCDGSVHGSPLFEFVADFCGDDIAPVVIKIDVAAV